MKVDATLNAAEWAVLPDVARRREAGHDGTWNDGRSLAGPCRHRDAARPGERVDVEPGRARRPA